MEDIIFPVLANDHVVQAWYAPTGPPEFRWKDMYEAAIRVGLPTLLILLLALASWRSITLRSLERRARARTSRWILYGKIVSITTEAGRCLTWFNRRFLPAHLNAVWQVLSSLELFVTLHHRYFPTPVNLLRCSRLSSLRP
jgi:hypothetical protein